MHSPAGRWSVQSLAGWSSSTWLMGFDILHEQRAPVVLFSVCAFSQLQWSAGCLPQLHLASFAHMHPPSRPQQVAGTAAVVETIMVVEVT